MSARAGLTPEIALPSQQGHGPSPFLVPGGMLLLEQQARKTRGKYQTPVEKKGRKRQQLVCHRFHTEESQIECIFQYARSYKSV